MMRIRNRLSVRAFVVLAVAMAALVAIGGVNLHQRLTNHERHEVRLSATEFANTVSDVIVTSPHLYCSDFLQPFLLRAGGRLRDTRRIMAVDTALRIVADSGIVDLGKTAAAGVFLRTLQDGIEASAEYTAGGQFEYRLVVPISGFYDPSGHSEIIGALAVEMDLGAADARVMYDLLQSGIFLIGGIAAISLGLAAWFQARIGRRLATVSMAIRNPDESGIPRELPSLGDDEIGELGAALNRMGKDLTSTTVALREAKTAAEAANAARSEFLAIASHEIRAPLGGVIGILTLLAESDLEPEQRSELETARRSAENLLILINSILDLSRLEAGKLDLEAVPFDLLSVAEDVVVLLGVRAEEKGLDLVLSYAPAAPRYLIGDGARIREVLLNLAGNAVKFTRSGHVLIGIEGEPGEEGTDRLLRVQVEDTGIGISPDNVDRVFEKFSQGDASTTRRFGGTGLGLTIAKSLVELMGGEIGVESRPGEGSRFWFTLRLPPAPEPASRPRHEELPRLRILVADDSDLIRGVLRERLAGMGLETAGAVTGHEALSELRRAASRGEPFDVALVDHRLPDMTGIELGEAIRSDAGGAATVLILLWSAARPLPSAAIEAVGFGATLLKPIRPSALLGAIAAAASAASDTPKPAAPPSTGLAARPRVLVVDDNPTDRQVETLGLERFGCRVDSATGGREALGIVDRVSYDLVIMDLAMPGMDGPALAREIRRREGPNRHVPIVGVTARSAPGDREACLAAGFDGHAVKPVRLADLKAILDRWVSIPGREGGVGG